LAKHVIKQKQTNDMHAPFRIKSVFAIRLSVKCIGTACEKSSPAAASILYKYNNAYLGKLVAEKQFLPCLQENARKMLPVNLAC